MFASLISNIVSVQTQLLKIIPLGLWKQSDANRGYIVPTFVSDNLRMSILQIVRVSKVQISSTPLSPIYEFSC